MKCEVVRDLLPSYIDGLTSGVTNEEIEKHLDECVTCRQYYREMRQKDFGVSVGILDQVREDSGSRKKDRDHRVLRKFRRIRLKWIAIICMSIMIVLVGFFWVTNLFIPLPYEKVQIEADIQKPETEEIEFDDGTSQTLRSGGIRVTEKAGMYGFNYMDCRYRKMVIDGEERAVAFVNCQILVSDYLFHHEAVESGGEAIWVQSSVKDKDFENVDLIYYLDKGIDRIEVVGEEEALKLIDDCGTLLWEEGGFN